MITTTTLGNEQRIAIPLERWMALLELERRLLLESLGPDLHFAGIPVPHAGPAGADYWPHFVQFVENLTLPR
ncbi:MAG: hypothetical protein WA862_12105 [Solirubrobacterales bacterium]